MATGREQWERKQAGPRGDAADGSGRRVSGESTLSAGRASAGESGAAGSETVTKGVGSSSLIQALGELFEKKPKVELKATPNEEPPPGMPFAEGGGAGAGGVGKYRVGKSLGRGGMGFVQSAFDVDLRRWVAMKVVRRDVARDADHLSRFIEEAQVCGQLEHPNIPPVHELGLDHDGRVYFTMKMVNGHTLGAIVRDLRGNKEDARREFTPIRIAQIMQQAAMGVHYANVRGIIHRDLKPENIMLGDFGEVFVMDWGLSKVMGTDERRQWNDESGEIGDAESIDTARRNSGRATLAGSVQGSPSYMSPEQANGWLDQIDSRTDVFGLGAVLYELLCFQPPHPGERLVDVIRAAREGRPLPPSHVVQSDRVPGDLEAICMKALAKNKGDRYPSARAFERDLQSYIDGSRDRERRRTAALAMVEESERHVGAYDKLHDEAEGLRTRAQQVAKRIAPYDPIEKKRDLWHIEAAAERAARDAETRFGDAESILNAAIQTDPECESARHMLASLYWDRFLQAEEAGDVASSALYRGLVTTYDDGYYSDKLKGDGELSIETLPAGAEAILYRYEERDKVLVPLAPERLGVTPLPPAPIAMGSYLLVLRKEGYPDTRYPLLVRRSEKHEARVQLYTGDEIGPGFSYVPGGMFIRGGDPESYGSLERANANAGDFFIARFPVTFGEYCEFLNAKEAAGEDVQQHIPQQAEERFVERGKDGLYQPSELLSEEAVGQRYSVGYERDLPVFSVSWFSASAYARWRSERDGREYTLPDEDAWEKAARGVDGRSFPWGDYFDWTFTKGGLSREELKQPEPVGAFELDESPYGVRDMGGGIREWTSTIFDERTQSRVLRGGAWNLVVARHFRCCTRFGYLPDTGATTFGFRLCCRAQSDGSRFAGK